MPASKLLKKWNFNGVLVWYGKISLVMTVEKTYLR
jgi:hypothetical protein